MIQKTKITTLLFCCILLFACPAYAHDPEGMGRLVLTSLIIDIIGAAVFLKFLNKYISRKTNWKSKISGFIWVIFSILLFVGCTILFFFPALYLTKAIIEYYESGFYLRFGFIASIMIGTILLFFALKYILRKTENKDNTTRIAWVVVGVLVSCCVALLVSPQYTLFNKTNTNTLIVEYCDNTQVQIKRIRSLPTYILIIPLGKEEREIYQWTKDGILYKWETWFYPMIINEYEGIHYLVEIEMFGISEYGKRTYGLPATFKFYRFFSESWEEISDKEFPKILAVQNMGQFQSQIDDIKPINPKNFNFRHSYTGVLWVQLETGKKMHYKSFGGSHNYPEKFFADFIDKYMR